MKEIIEDIRIMLKEGLFKDEQHVRFSLVARICQALGWKIWNPAEFYTELQVPKLRAPKNGVQEQGKVDIALIKLTNRKREKHIFFEVKSVGNMYKDIQNARGQLEEYSLKFGVPLSILTDGRKWEFYLNSLSIKTGRYQDRIINSIDIIDDDIDGIDVLLNGLMGSQISSASLILLGKKMHKEYLIIKFIKEVKHDLESLYPNDVLKQTREAVKTINEKHGNRTIKLEEVTEYWNSRIALGGLGQPPPPPPQPPAPPETDYTDTTPLRLFVIDKWFDVPETSWANVKKLTFENIIEKGGKITLEGRMGVFKVPEINRRAKLLKTGDYIDTGYRANDIVDHCIRAIKAAGYSPIKSWAVEFVKNQAKKENQ